MAEINVNPQLSQNEQNKQAIINWANNLSPEEASTRAAILKKHLDRANEVGGKPDKILSDSYDSVVKRSKGGG